MADLKNIENLYKKIFLLLLGSFLMVIPFYASSRSMLLLSDKVAEWTNTHTIILCLGIMFFVGGVMFNKFAELVLRFWSALVDKFIKK